MITDVSIALVSASTDTRKLHSKLGRGNIGWILLCLSAVSSACLAQEASPELKKDETPTFKLTVGAYRFSGGANAVDTNLRWNNEYGNVWGGFYDSRQQHEHQLRLGWDNSIDMSSLRFIPSVQIASHGYLAGSVNIETGGTWFAGMGLGRTNLKPNWNLNFDPNDSYSLSAGLRQKTGESVTLQWIQDNRDNPDQRHLHIVYRTPLPQNNRLTLDALFKQGLVNGVTIHKFGATVTYDWSKFFTRIAYDPNVNFSAENMVRLSMGTRF